MLFLWLALILISLSIIHSLVTHLISWRVQGFHFPIKGAMKGIVVAALCNLALLLLYPLGLLPQGRTSPDVIKKNRPLLFVHGYFHNRSAFFPLRWYLRRRGLGHLYDINLRPRLGRIEDYAPQLSLRISEILKETGEDKIDLIGHSMGGLVCRYYIQELGGRVDKLITLATPHQGTEVARLGPGENARQMVPGSPLLKRLNQDEGWMEGVKVVSLWSSFDAMIIPARSAILTGRSENIHLPLTGHNTFLFSRQVAAQLVRVLTSHQGREDADHVPIP